MREKSWASRREMTRNTGPTASARPVVAIATTASPCRSSPRSILPREAWLAQARVMDLVLGAEGDCRPGRTGARNSPCDDRPPEHPVAHRAKLNRHHHPDRQQFERGASDKIATCIHMPDPVTLSFIFKHK